MQSLQHTILNLMLFFLKLFFWFALFLVFYSYVGYGILLYLIIKIKGRKSSPTFVKQPDKDLPDVTLIVAAYNEENYIEPKIENSLRLNYPKEKLHFFFVTDGSTDSTNERILNHKNSFGSRIQLFFQPERRGKIAAVERIMPFVETPIIVFSDANTDLNPDAILNIVKHYQNPEVGAVAGEKRVNLSAEAAGIGEGVYWKYESQLKKWDYQLYSVVGAAGELFSMRTALHQPVERDTLIEDFVTTMRIAKNGYRVGYAPDAYAVEGHSANVKEELKRKIRISAGGLQAIWRLRALLNPFKYGVLTFQYVSHRVLRWTLAPLFLPLIFFLNYYFVRTAAQPVTLYKLLIWAQVFFYAAAILGWIFEQLKMKVKIFYVPYYFCVINYSVYRGFLRLVAGSQSVVWEKAKRAE